MNKKEKHYICEKIDYNKITEKVKELSVILFDYESNEPYSVGESIGTDYVHDWDYIEKQLKREHSGDCTNQPWSCITCYAEHIVRKAIYIYEKENGK